MGGDGETGRPVGYEAREDVRCEVDLRWLGFVRFCEEMGAGTISELHIVDGIPVLGEVTRRNVRFWIGA
jgi:hypothetical protein